MTTSQIRRIDIQIDRYQLASGRLAQASVSDVDGNQGLETSSRSSSLTAIARALSTNSSSPLVRRRTLRALLEQARHGEPVDPTLTNISSQESDLEWLVVDKAAVQVYGMILTTLLEQTIPLSQEMWYWDEVLGSYFNTALYTIQTAPLRLWSQAKDIYGDASRKFRSQRAHRVLSQEASQRLSDGWRQFYDLVRESIKDRSLAQAQTKALSPFAVRRREARKKQKGLKRLREMNSAGLGLLIDEGLSFPVVDDDALGLKAEGSPYPSQEEWRSTVAKSISLMESILRNVNTLDSGVADFEEGVFTSVEEDPEIASLPSESNGSLIRTSQLYDRLLLILNEHLPGQEQRSKTLSRKYGRPNSLTRYWPLGTFFILFGSTTLRYVANRKAEIRIWVQELGATVLDFWANWVVEPVKNLVATIRHDEGSEVAIMSKDSLRADRASLERMVVDFAADHPSDTGATYSTSEIEVIRTKVREGDLTPVLRAYERDLRSPFVGTIRGDLVRALLIQVQKTKVDVEVAIGGIDSLLKSQELVFGLVGLTPGLLITFACFRWLGGVFGKRRGLRQNQEQRDTIRLLRLDSVFSLEFPKLTLCRNIDRVLTSSTPAENGMLSYKDHGLLLCEVHVLRQRGAAALPGEIQREFLEDVDDLLDIRYGIQRQVKVVERIQWAYARWLR
jgi:nuclear control of ATPase protein 2